MDLAKFIQNLQKKPEPTKKFILWASTAVIMLVIGSGWLVSSQVGGTVSMNSSQPKQQENKLGNIFKSFKNDMASLKGTIIPKTNQNSQKETNKDQSASQKARKDQTESKTEQERNLYKLPLSE